MQFENDYTEVYINTSRIKEQLNYIFGFLPALTFRKNKTQLNEILKDREQSILKRQKTENELEALGFDIHNGLYSNPLNGLGTSLEILEKYKATVHRGTCYSDCRISIPKETWQHLLRDNPDMTVPSLWTTENIKLSEVEEISVWGRNVQEATANMLIYCRRAGVI